jgi:ATP-dependent DNA ligase
VAQASLTAFDFLRLDGKNLRPTEARRKALMRLVDDVKGILFSEALAAEGAIVFAKACELGLEDMVVEAGGQLLSRWTEPQLAEDKEPEFRQE